MWPTHIVESYLLYSESTDWNVAKSFQSCPTLWDPIDGSPLGSPVPGILQARTLEWVAISFSNEWKWKVKVKSLSRVWLLATPWTAVYQAPPCMGFSRQEYWSGVPLPRDFPGDSVGKESAWNIGDWIPSLGREDPLEEGMAIHSSILAWRIPWTAEPGRLQFMGSRRVRHNWSDWVCTYI